MPRDLNCNQDVRQDQEHPLIVIDQRCFAEVTRFQNREEDANKKNNNHKKILRYYIHQVKKKNRFLQKARKKERIDFTAFTKKRTKRMAYTYYQLALVFILGGVFLSMMVILFYGAVCAEHLAECIRASVFNAEMYNTNYNNNNNTQQNQNDQYHYQIDITQDTIPSLLTSVNTAHIETHIETSLL